jgi:dimethylaniline monooxygenase (N-oxide forming)
MVEVAVIGAGAAGLTAARHLLKAGLRTWVFDAAPQVAGAWAGSRKMMWEHLRPNLSKATCVFSDFDWPEDTPDFPTRCQMGDYLTSYADEYVVKDEKCTLKLGCRVHNIFPSDPYTVEWTDCDGSLRSQEFGGVVVASGFFTAQKWPSCLEESPELRDNHPNIIHSCEYQNAKFYNNKKVAVLGGAFSAHEIACDIAANGAPRRVVNVIGSHFTYVLPRYVPDGRNGQFAPLDSVLYRRQSCASDLPMKLSLVGDDCKKRHAFLQGLIGARTIQSMINKGYHPLPAPDSIPRVSISDVYTSMVIGDKIQVQQGRVVSIVEGQDKRFCLHLDNGHVIDEVDCVVAGTGYVNRLDFLAESIREIIEYDSTDAFAPMILCHDTYHPKLPGLGFVGMTKGIYFGVMELQARTLPYDPAPLCDSRVIRETQPRAQFPRFDYVGFMDTLAKPLGLVPDPDKYGAIGNMVSPVHYRHSSELYEPEFKRNSGACPIAIIALNALVGSWTFARTIEDHVTNAVQRVSGVVQYRILDDGLRYREDGDLELPNGNKLTVFREYDYTTTNDGKTMDIYFVDQGKRTYLFLSLLFQRQSQDGTWTATSDHLCVKDLYKGTFRITFDGIGAAHVSMSYRVNGPNKDYESTTSLSQFV